MWRFLLGRLCLSLLLVIAASAAMMGIVSRTPGDAVRVRILEGMTLDQIQAERERLGLDRPLGERYLHWFARTARLDFGTSFRYEVPVAGLVAGRARNSVVLAGAALIVATIIALPLGLIAGSGRFPRSAALIGAGSLILLSLPPLLTALLFTFAAARTGWLPVGGLNSVGAEDLPLVGRLGDLLRHLAIPALALGLPLGAALERVQTTAVAEGRHARHVLAAMARGVPLPFLWWRHLWRPTASPVAAVFGLAAGTLLSGSLAVELVSGWPGLGRLMFEALSSRDVPLAAGCAAAAAAFLAVWTTMADVAGWWVDPRTRPGAEG